MTNAEFNLRTLKHASASSLRCSFKTTCGSFDCQRGDRRPHFAKHFSERKADLIRALQADSSVETYTYAFNVCLALLRSSAWDNVSRNDVRGAARAKMFGGKCLLDTISIMMTATGFGVSPNAESARAAAARWSLLRADVFAAAPVGVVTAIEGFADHLTPATPRSEPYEAKVYLPDARRYLVVSDERAAAAVLGFAVLHRGAHHS